VAKSSTRRLLYFAPKECWPPSTGGQLRNFYLARELAAAGEVVTYLGFSDGRARAADQAGTYEFAGRNPVGEWCEKLITLPLETTYTPAKLARGLIGRTPLPVLNYTTPQMQAALTQLLDESDFDLVHVQGLHLADYLPLIRAARSRPKVICDWHNVESELMQRYGERAGSAPKRAYAALTARRMAGMEKRIVREFDAHICVSERDKEQIMALGPTAPVVVIENGVNVEYFTPKPTDPPAKKHRIVFVGSMDYHANVDAVLHFAREAWPLVHQQLPQLTFTIVGRNPAPEVAALGQQPSIEVTGRVRDVRPYLREAFASVVPLRIGGGSRLKILEAMAAGLPLVSSALGAEGIDVRHGENILLAETPAEFAAAIAQICQDETLQRRLAEAGRRLVEAHYDWPAVVANLRALHEELLKSA
jgi:polysaccharide biosynthesis protein PslH